LLEHVITEKGIACDPDKISAITQLETPKNVTGVRSFLGVTGYYRKCIPYYSKIAAPLTKLTKKYQRFTWGEDEQTAFETLKQLLTSNPELPGENDENVQPDSLNLTDVQKYQEIEFPEEIKEALLENDDSMYVFKD